MTETTAATSQVPEDAGALVVYASTHGHTAKIATRLADAMRAQGLAVELTHIDHAGHLTPAHYDLVVVAASVHKAGHQKAVSAWVGEHRDGLAIVPSVFISVSLSAAEDTDAARATTQHLVDEFRAQTGWSPTRTECVAGSLQYREYDPFTRQLMRLLMHHMGHPTDASRDYDYTDWDAVDRLGGELAAIRVSAVVA